MEQISSPTIPVHLGERRRSSINLKFIFGGAVLLVLAGLIVWGTATTGAYYLTVAEVLDQGPSLAGQRIRVNGQVVEDSEDWNAQEVTLRFAIRDMPEDGEPATVAGDALELPIVFYGPRPDNFQRAASAIIEGELLSDGTFKADQLLLKCPSRYEEEPEEILVKSVR
jgi:cytochrome c-type biogenesis protein CcmE